MNQSRARYIYNPVMLWRVVAAMLAGIALAFSFPLSLPAVDAFPELGVWHFFIGGKDISAGFLQLQGLGCIALIPLFAALRGSRRPAHAFWLGYICGLAWLIPGLIWLGSFGVAPVVMLPFYFALPLGLFGYLCWWLLNTPWAAASPARFVWGVPIIWTAIEYLRSFGFWAFPWNLLGYSLAREPLLIQTADLGGVYAVSFAILLCNTALSVLLLRPPAELLERLRPLKAWRWPSRLGQASAAVALLCAMLVYGLWRLDELKLPQLWPLAMAAPLEQQDASTSNSSAEGNKQATDAKLTGAKPRADNESKADESRAGEGSASQRSGAADKGKSKDKGKDKSNDKIKAKHNDKPKPAVQIEVERPLDVILVQGGLNTRESWKKSGRLERAVEAYATPSAAAIELWKASQPPPGKAGSSSSAVSFRPPADGPGAATRKHYAPPLGDLGVVPGTIARDEDFSSAMMDADDLRIATQPPAKQDSAAKISSAKPGSTQRPLPDERNRAAQPDLKSALSNLQSEDADLLVIWPESVLPLYLDPSKSANLPRECRQLLRKAPNTALLLGAIGEPRMPGQLENGAMFFTREGSAIWPHSKVRVVPFGEVVPFRRAISILDYPWGPEDVTEGRFIQPLVWKSHSLGMLICFDNVFGFLSRREALAGADSFVLITNNSWYKLSSGVRQHADIDILRAVENRRALARVSTTGESHLIDSAGRVQQKSGQQSAAVLSGRLERSKEVPVYHRVGDLFSQLCLLGALLLCVPPILLRRGEGFL